MAGEKPDLAQRRLLPSREWGGGHRERARHRTRGLFSFWRHRLMAGRSPLKAETRVRFSVALPSLEDVVTEKEIRLDEVGLLEKHMNDNGIARADMNGPQRRFLKRRRAEIATVEDTGFPESKVRLEEVAALETHCQRAQIGIDNPDHPLRAYAKSRRAELTPKVPLKTESVAAVRGATLAPPAKPKVKPPYTK
jgi:hypothetical protein